MTVFPLNPNFAFAACVSREGRSGIPCGMTSILSSRHVMRGRADSRPFSDMTTIFVETPMIWRITSRCAGVGFVSTV